MPPEFIDSEVSEQIQIFRGQKSAVPTQALQAGDCEKITNFLIRKGKLRKAWGASLYANPNLGGIGGISWLDTFRYRWMYQQFGIAPTFVAPIVAEVSAQIAYEDGVGDGTFTVIGSMDGGKKVRSDKWRNAIYLVNGIRNKFYEDSPFLGAKFLNLGLTPPGNGRVDGPGTAPDLGVTQANSSGTLVDTTKYRYLMTWWDDTRQIESLPNGASVDADGLWSGNNPAEITIAAPADTVTLDPAALKAAGYDTDRVTHMIFYRALYSASTDSYGDYARISNDAGGSAGMFPIAYASAITDGDPTEANRGTVLDESLSPPPSGFNYFGNDNDSYTEYGPRFVRENNDQLWLFGVQYPGSATLGSLPANGVLYGSDVGNADYFKYSYDIARNSDQRDTGLARFRNTLLMFKSESTYYLDGNNPTNYVVKEMDTKLGCVAPDSIQETPVGVIALSRQGFILVDSIGPSNLISQEVFDEINKINFDYADLFTSAFDIKEGKYECHVVVGNSSKVNYVMIYDVNMKDWQFKRGNGYGGAVKYGLSSVGAPIGLLGDRENSKLYSIVNTEVVTFNDQTIRGVWKSKHFDFGHPSRAKGLKLLKINARAKEDFTLSFDVIMDHGQQQSWSVNDVSSQSVVSRYATDENDDDGAEYDEDNYMGDYVYKKFEVLLTGVAENFQLVIREHQTADNKAGFEIDEIILEAELLER